MRRLFFSLTLPLFLLLLVGCARTPKIVSQPNSFSRESTLVVSKYTDPFSIHPKLEYILSSKGFNVVSNSALRDRRKHKKASKNGPSDYILTFSYSVQADEMYGYIFSKFTAVIINRYTGESVVTVYFHQADLGARTIPDVLEELADKLAELFPE